MARRPLQASMKTSKLYAGEIPDTKWIAPNGKIIGVFFQEKFYSSPDEMETPLGRPYVESLPNISSVVDALQYMEKIKQEKIPPSELGKLVQMASDWK